VALLAALVTPARVLPTAALLLSPTSAFLLWRVFHPYPDWYMPRDYARAVAVLHDACADGDVALAPSDLSLMIAGLTPCRVALGHRGLTPAWPAAVAAGTRFYDRATPAPWRTAYVDSIGADFILLPAGGGPMLGGDPRFTAREGLPLLEIWQAAPTR
jgi:hypothetical protein